MRCVWLHVALLAHGMVAQTWLVPTVRISSQVKHVNNIPALAYVAEGKTQKRHLLIGKAAHRA